MNILAWIFFGMIFGALADVLDPLPKRGGIVAAVIVGSLGSVIGGFIANMLFGNPLTSISLPTLLIATAGCLFVLFFVRGIQKV